MGPSFRHGESAEGVIQSVNLKTVHIHQTPPGPPPAPAGNLSRGVSTRALPRAIGERGLVRRRIVMPNLGLDALTYLLARKVKPRVFVSYHHENDQWYADRFTALFDDTYDAVTDRSLNEALDSDNSEYIYQRIRDEFISYTSCTIVLCGVETPNRKHVDWEIKATLDKQHGLLAVQLPTNGRFIVPIRLFDNSQSGYAHSIAWTENALLMTFAINLAREQAKNTRLIVNSRPMMVRNS